MRTLKINKENWSGEQATLMVTKDGSFEVYGYRFKLTQTSPIGFEVTGEGWDYPLVHGLKVDDTWVAASGRTVDALEGPYSREDADPVAAAAKVLFNII